MKRKGSILRTPCRKPRSKKPTKTEIFRDEVRRVMEQDKPLTILHREYEDFIQSQTILKKSLKSLRGQYRPWVFVINKMSRDYMAANDVPEFECLYVKDFEDKIWQFRDMWNESGLPWIPDYQMHPIISFEAQKIKRRFKELNPAMAEADATLRAMVQLDKVGVKNKLLEQRFCELTNNHDPIIIANLPLIVEIIEEKEYEESLNGKAYKQSGKTTKPQ